MLAPIALFLLSLPATGVSEVKTQAEASVLILDFTTTNEDTESAQLVTQLVAAEVAKREDLQVFTSEDLRRVIGLEAEKQAADCDAESSCLTELADALGAGTVVFGSVGKLGNTVIINLSFFNSREARSAGRSLIESPSLDEVPARVRDELASTLSRLMPPPEGAPPASLAHASPWLTGTLIGVGGLALVGGGIGAGLMEARLWDKESEFTAKQGEQQLGWVFLGVAVVGAVAAGTGALMLGGEG